MSRQKTTFRSSVFPHSLRLCAARRCPRLFLALFAAAVGRTISAEPEGVSPHTDSPVDMFKSFLESPPAIGHLVFREKLPPNLGQWKQPNEGISKSTNFANYSASWSPNIFQLTLLRSGNSNEAGNAGSYAGFQISRLTNDYWLLSGAFAYHWHDNFRSSALATVSNIHKANLVISTYGEVRRRFCQIMNMGVLHLEPGTIQWNGNQFSEVSKELDVEIRGVLRVSEDGLPNELGLVYNDIRGSNEVRSLVQYSYERHTALGCLPSFIRIYVIRGGKKVEWDEFRILRIGSADGEPMINDFDPSRLALQNRLAVRVYTNGALFSIDSTGSLQPIRTTNPKRVGRRSISPLIFYGMVAGVTVGYFVIANRTKRNELVPAATANH